MLFSILKGNSANISKDKTAFHEGWAYFTPDTGKFYIDAKVGASEERILLNPDVPDDISEFNNDAGYVTTDTVYTKSEIDEYELVTTTSINEICTAEILQASEVTY